jgi:hypothetical protein
MSAWPACRACSLLTFTRRDLPGGRAGALELGDDVGDGLVGCYVPARVVAAGIPGDLLARLAPQVVLEPVALHGGGVADQAGQGGQRGHQTPAGVLLGQAVQLRAERAAVVLEELLQGLPFWGTATGSSSSAGCRVSVTVRGYDHEVGGYGGLRLGPRMRRQIKPMISNGP